LGKNMIGAFYQPECVIADIATLNTLPDREFISGVSEVIKYGLIRDPEFFIWQENNMASLLNRNASSLSDAIYLSCVNKAAVVAADEKEAGVRATLNLGHTFGHAIEAGLGYGTWLHGEAVGAGISMATDLSLKQGLIDSTLAARIKKLLISSGLPIDLRNPFAQTEVGEKAYTELLSGLTKDKFLDLMSMDKKVSNGQLNLILLSGALGTSIITDKFDPQLLDSVLDDYLVPAEAKI